MILLGSLFRDVDFLAAPICFIILLMVFSVIIVKYKDDRTRTLFLQAFYFKMACALIFTAFSSFYYSGGDSEMYYFAGLHLHEAVMDDPNNFVKIFLTKVINVKTTLMDYFIYDTSIYPIWEAMHGEGNFFVPKLGLPFLLVFQKSYLCTAMCFSFFAFGGSIRLYKFFVYYFPEYWREIALATLFLPSAVFWSSGMLKDPICFGSVGFLIYGVFNIAIRRHKFVTSIAWIAVSVVFLFYIKPYILFALLPGIVLWLFTEMNKLIGNRTLRNIFTVLTLVGGAISAFYLIQYTTSDDSVKSFRLDTIIETSAASRNQYAEFSETEAGAYYTIGTTNPVLVFLNGIVATFFRPFPWEISSPIVALSVIEAMFFLFIAMSVIFKRGLFYFFRKIFAHPVFMLCFVFAFVFAAAVGSTATNFGSLSRYKIPAMPFFLVMILILYRQAGLIYPNWFKRLLGYRIYLPKEKSAF